MRERPNLATLVADWERHGRDTAVVSHTGVRRRVTTYSELAVSARRFAAEFRNRGISKGDRVVIWAENSAEWIAAFFGCVLRGIIAVPLDVAGSEEFTRRVVADVSPRLILGRTGLALTPHPEITAELADAIPDLQASDPLQLVFTSGTTSEPKGVVHTHGNVLASLLPIEREAGKYLKYERPFHPIRILHTLPLSHVFGQFMGLWIPPIIGSEIHFASDLVGSRIVERIRRERISVLASVPRVLDLLRSHLLSVYPDLPARMESNAGAPALAKWWKFQKIHQLFGLKFWACVCGGSALPAPVEKFWSALGFLVVQGYGMTETTALVSLNHPFKAAKGSVGQVLPGREIRLAPDGEILVRGETIANSVWKNGAIQNTDSEWLATGDLGELDESGNLHFRGRKKDTIVTAAGMNIHPEDLESALMQTGLLKAAAVVETESSAGPEPMAVVVPQAGCDAAQAVHLANLNLAEFQRIHNWMVWPEPDLPRTSTGKVLKREIAARKDLQQQGAGDAAEVLDSLGKVELQARLEQQYGVTIDDAAIAQVKSAADVPRLIAATASQPVSDDKHRYLHWPWNPFVQAIRTIFLEVVAMPLVRGLTRARVENVVTTLPAGPVLIVANHVTTYDGPFVLYALPRRVRDRVAAAMSGEMLLDYREGRNQGNWFLNAVAPVAYLLMTALFNIFPLPRSAGFRKSFAHAGEAMDRGYSVLVFPEGHRSDDGKPQAFRGGAGLLWKQLGVPAIAVHIAGLGEIKASGSKWFRRGNITVSVKAVLPPPTGQESNEELVRRLYAAVFGAAE